MKVRMATRHMAPWREKLERGLIYNLEDKYAQELISHGIAVLVVEMPPVEATVPPPGFVAVNMMPPKAKITKVYSKKKTKGN